jgi:hypothetical protein
VPGDQIAGRGHGDQRAGAEAQNQKAEREFADIQAVERDRDLRRPGPDQKPVHQKDRGDGPAPALQLVE